MMMYNITIATLLASLATARCRSDLIKAKPEPVVTECSLNLYKIDEDEIVKPIVEEKKMEKEKIESSKIG